MAHRTRRRAVKRKQRDTSLARHLKLCGDLRLIHERTSREMRVAGIAALSSAMQFTVAPGCKIMRGDRLRWSDIPDGPRVAVKHCEIVFAKGVIAK